MTVMMWIRAVLLALALACSVWAYVDNRQQQRTSGDADMAAAFGEGLLVVLSVVLTTLAVGSWLVQLVWRAIFD